MGENEQILNVLTFNILKFEKYAIGTQLAASTWQS